MFFKVYLFFFAYLIRITLIFWVQLLNVYSINPIWDAAPGTRGAGEAAGWLASWHSSKKWSHRSAVGPFRRRQAAGISWCVLGTGSAGCLALHSVVQPGAAALGVCQLRLLIMIMAAGLDRDRAQDSTSWALRNCFRLWSNDRMLGRSVDFLINARMLLGGVPAFCPIPTPPPLLIGCN